VLLATGGWLLATGYDSFSKEDHLSRINCQLQVACRQPKSEDCQPPVASCQPHKIGSIKRY